MIALNSCFQVLLNKKIFNRQKSKFFKEQKMLEHHLIVFLKKDKYEENNKFGKKESLDRNFAQS